MRQIGIERGICYSLWLAALSAALINCGCAKESLRGPGYSDEWNERLRQPEAAKGDPWGFSTKARQIEANLGIE